MCNSVSICTYKHFHYHYDDLQDVTTFLDKEKKKEKKM